MLLISSTLDHPGNILHHALRRRQYAPYLDTYITRIKKHTKCETRSAFVHAMYGVFVFALI